MLNFFPVLTLPAIFFLVLFISLLSGLLLLYPKVPLTYVRIHIGMISLPPLVALLALIVQKNSILFGPWRFDSLSWLLALFVLTIGLIVQRYSVHYLFGDRIYRQYFTLLTLTTGADSLTWVSNDLRFLLVCWGTTLLGLIWLIRLKKEWQIARQVAALTARFFALNWFILLFAVLFVREASGHWQLSLIFAQKNLGLLDSWEKTWISLLLAAAVMIPAAQWPFHRWLLDSTVAPTPVSAVMHAGIVNAGGIMLTRFSPLFNGSSAQLFLLVLSSISVLMGTGIMFVHVDYKRKLVGSTIAQMGFMLIQCALGAYEAAIIHAVLHGIFKATLFLQAGSAVQHKQPLKQRSEQPSLAWTIYGGILGLLVGLGFWLTAPETGYQMISSIVLGWSVTLSWSQLVAFGRGYAGRIAGFFLLTGSVAIYNIIHTTFYELLHETVHNASQPFSQGAIWFFIILSAGGVLGTWLARKASSIPFAVLYLWLVRLGEPHKNLVESHPTFLLKYLSRGGH